MKQILKILLLFLSLSFILASCKKDKASINGTDQLPPATQTGANTFGCLINGKVYIPLGYNGTGTPNPKVIYDLDLNGYPHLFIETHQYKNNNSVAGISLTFKNINHLGFYRISDSLKFSVGSNSILGECGVTSFDSNIQAISGGGEITKLDLTNGIISGQFNFKCKRSLCDTLNITDGRFDIKF